MKYKNIKRLFDIVISLTLIIVLSPLFLIVPITLQLTNETKQIGYFKQKRTGINGKEFDIYKFRSVIVKNNTDYVTKYGSIIRKFGIDELPQLINILKGDMSFIGPRPRPISYYEYYTDEQKKKLNVLPGILNPVISNDKDNANILEKINLEIEYVEKYSFRNDLDLIKNTITNLPSIIKNRNSGSYGNTKNLNNDLKILRENYINQMQSKQYNSDESTINDNVLEDIESKIPNISLTDSCDIIKCTQNSNTIDNVEITDEQLQNYEMLLNNLVENEQGLKLVKKI